MNVVTFETDKNKIIQGRFMAKRARRNFLNGDHKKSFGNRGRAIKTAGIKIIPVSDQQSISEIKIVASIHCVFVSTSCRIILETKIRFTGTNNVEVTNPIDPYFKAHRYQKRLVASENNAASEGMGSFNFSRRAVYHISEGQRINSVPPMMKL